MTPTQIAKSNTEDAHQAAIFCFSQQNLDKYPELEWLFAIPNGGLRDKITAAKLRATGVKSGVPDICLPIPMDGNYGLYIELKRPETDKQKAGTTSVNQDKWSLFLAEQRYYVKVCYGWLEAINIILAYLGYNVNIRG